MSLSYAASAWELTFRHTASISSFLQMQGSRLHPYS